MLTPDLLEIRCINSDARRFPEHCTKRSVFVKENLVPEETVHYYDDDRKIASLDIKKENIERSSKWNK